jgi:hypothetical protein
MTMKFHLFLIILLLAMPIDSCVGPRHPAPGSGGCAVVQPTPQPSPPCVDSGNGEVNCYPIDGSGKRH